MFSVFYSRKSIHKDNMSLIFDLSWLNTAGRNLWNNEKEPNNEEVEDCYSVFDISLDNKV